MSYNLQVYAVDIDRLRAAFGSSDATLVSAIKADQADEIKDNWNWFRDEIDGGAPTLDAAVEHIVAGTLPVDGPHGFQYGYAVEVLCRQLGEELELRGDLGFLAELGLETALLTSGPPLPVPPAADFPEVGFLTARQVTVELARFKATGVGGEDDEFAEAREELVGHLERAAELGVGVVAFTY